MAFGDDVRGELFDKLGVDKQNDPMSLLDQGDKEIAAGNHNKGKTLYQQAYQIAGSQVEKFLTQSQHRSAAQSLYVQALAQEKLGNTDDRDTLYSKVTDSLIAAADNALAFGEDNRGIATVTLAGLVCLMYDNQDRAYGIYSDYIKKAEEKQNAEFLKKLLYSLGYLLDALKNDNIAALTDAQNYISTDLRPLLSTSKLNTFDILLNSVVVHTQNVLQSRITMPKISFSSSVPNDLLFNQIFDLEITISNTGEGSASDVIMNFTIPTEIEILDGKTSETIGTFDPQSEIKRKFSLRFQTGDSTGEQDREISGELTYTDMLGNSHKQFFGPLQLTFSATSKKEEFNSRLNKLYQDLEETTELFGEIPDILLSQYMKMLTDQRELIADKIEEEDFDQVEFGLRLIQNSIAWIQDYTHESETSREVANEIRRQIATEKNMLKVELEEQHKSDKENAISMLEERLNRDKQEALKSLRENLETTYRQEIEQLKENHDSELRQMQTSHDNKLKQQLVQLENTLKEDFRRELDKKNEETENAIRELQDNELKAVENAKNSLREELNEKHDAQIKEMEGNMEEMERQLTARAEEEKQLELKSQQQRLELEHKENLEEQERLIREKMQQETDEKLDHKAVEIRKLKEELEQQEDEIRRLKEQLSASREASA